MPARPDASGPVAAPPSPLTLVVLAAGLGTRYGGFKQLAPVGPHAEALLDYGVYDAARAGFRKVVLVIREEVEELFERHMARFRGGLLEIAYARQALEPRASGRTKPWGTGHAVLAAAPQLGGPFAVMNADDFYGADAYRMLFEHLTSTAQHAVVGYALRETLSPHGGVSRAIAEVDDNGYLSRLTEVTDIVADGSGFTGRTVAREAVTLGGNELVSMNLWGFTPAVLPVLKRQFAHFLETRGRDPSAEFLLSEALGAQVVAGEARVRVLRCAERWFGMTHAADHAAVKDMLASREFVDDSMRPGRLELPAS